MNKKKLNEEEAVRWIKDTGVVELLRSGRNVSYPDLFIDPVQHWALSVLFSNSAILQGDNRRWYM